MTTDTSEEIQQRVREAQAGRQALCIVGAGTKAFYGNAPDGDPLHVSRHAGVVACEPTELFVTARAGTPISELETVLAGHGQMLGFEPPRFGGGGTVGGLVAAGLSGPRRVAAGAVRDFVLGAEMIDGRGERLRFGGTVMKNVAGYDVSRLLAGSLGTLGVITEVTFRTLPLPPAELTLRFELSQARAIERCNSLAGTPVPISASAWHDGIASLRLSGAAAAIQAARTVLGGEPLDDVTAAAFWTSLRDQSHPFFAAPLWRLSLPPTAGPLELHGETLLEWHGGQRWIQGDLEAEEVHAAAREAGGAATLFRAADEAQRVDVFAPLPPPLAALHRRLKQSFDPAGILNPGRLYAEF